MPDTRIAQALVAAGIPVTERTPTGWCHTRYYIAARNDSGQFVSLTRARALWRADGAPSQADKNISTR